MKNLNIFFVFVLIIGFASCKHKDKMKKEEKVTTVVQNPAADTTKADNYRFHVSFYSMGAGIDNDAQKKFVDWVNNYPKKIAFEETPWGREGEVDYCFKLSEFSATEQVEFIKKAKEILTGTELVHFNENVPCSHKK